MRADLLDTLRKLMEHERSANEIGNFAEAEAFANKFRDLMFAHDLTMASLGCQTPEWDEEFEPTPRYSIRQQAMERKPSWLETFADNLESERRGPLHQ